MSYFKEGDSDSHSQHYNTLTGLPSLMTNSASSANSVSSSLFKELLGETTTDSLLFLGAGKCVEE